MIIDVYIYCFKSEIIANTLSQYSLIHREGLSKVYLFPNVFD